MTTKTKKNYPIKKIELLKIREATNTLIRSADDVYFLMTEDSKADRECGWILHLNTKNKVIDKELIAMGTLNSFILHMREVFRKAIINSSNSIIFIHNHPSGDVTPSENDKIITKRLKSAGELLGIPVIDSIIIGNGYYSFKDKNMI